MALQRATSVTTDQMVQFLRQMLLIRRFEERCAEMYTRGRIGGFLHLYVGEEAVGVGVVNALAPQDAMITHYRDHGHALARGMKPKVLMAELFGRVTGSSKGKGGSMHLFDASLGLLGGHAIVGSQLPVACGVALAAQYRGEDGVTAVFFGDGAVNQGEFHEALNLAAVWNLPILFLLENNGYGMGTRVNRVTAQTEIYMLAERYRIPARRINGMDVVTVYEETKEVVNYIRSGHGPFFLEALCYRFRGHSMADPQEYRKKEEETLWEARDPIHVLQDRLVAEAVLTQAQVDALWQDVEREVEEAIQFAEQSPLPPPEELHQDVYAPGG
jgi:pyruvate dehydrogenase E1 component alpha subunit